ncbi:hypothetical protein BD408DRAFT_444704 [Parasitella parasitica]|nr:hypothetical protein BD408DRAFT_444704 [Parasitella parasitica]
MSQQQQQYYSDIAENIPLSQVPTSDEKHGQNVYDPQSQQYDTTYQRVPNVESMNSLQHLQRESAVSLYLKPLLNIVVSSFLTIALLLLFLYADGKPLDFTIAGLKIPSLVSFLLSANLIFIASGISRAIAEYKWVRLSDGAKLTVIEIYDECTRGLSGFTSAFKAYHFDWILLVALVFNIGLLIISPASQEILTPIVETVSNSSYKIKFYYMRAEELGGRSSLQGSGMAPKLNGLTANAYISASSFAQAATGSKQTPIFDCPSGSAYCLFKNVTYISTKMTCDTVSPDETAIVNRRGTERFVVVLKEYFTSLNISMNPQKFPHFYYSGNMVNRTYWDLANYTAPLMPGLSIPEIFADKNVYDPRYRPYVGDQSFIMAYNRSSQINSYLNINGSYLDLEFKKCYFNSSYVSSTWRTANGSLEQYSVESTVPIVMDYDKVIGNNTGNNYDAMVAHPMSAVMINAYIMQQTIIAELVAPKYYSIYDYLRSFLQIEGFKYSKDLFPFEAFMQYALRAFDYAYFQAPYVDSRFEPIIWGGNQGVAVFNLEPKYSVKREASYALCLCLFLPVVWWVAIWIVSIRKSNGVARGSSQIALLTASLTPLAQHNLSRFSNMDCSNAFKHSKNVKVRIGAFTNNNQKEIFAFGMDNEENLKPLK